MALSKEEYPVVFYIENKHRGVHKIETSEESEEDILIMLKTIGEPIKYIPDDRYHKKIKYPLRIGIEKNGSVVGYVTCKDPDKNDFIDHVRKNKFSFWFSVSVIVGCILYLIFH